MDILKFSAPEVICLFFFSPSPCTFQTGAIKLIRQIKWHDEKCSSQNVYFFFSSGTSTSKPKLIPYFDSSLAKSASSVAHQTSSALLQRSSFDQTICTSFNFVYPSFSSIQFFLLQQVISPNKICQQSSMVPLCRKCNCNRSRVQGDGCFCIPFSQQHPNTFTTALNVRQPP